MRLNVEIDTHLHTRLKVRAAELGRPLAAIVTELLNAWLNERPVSITKKLALSESNEPDLKGIFKELGSLHKKLTKLT